MRVLLTNDDGFKANGITALYNEFTKHYNVSLVAPFEEMSATSRSMTIKEALKIKKHKSDKAHEIYSITGTPVDCVKTYFEAISKDRVFLVISGINHGVNTGIDIHYSGTVGAAMEGYFYGINSVAFSVDVDNGEPDFTRIAFWSKKIIDYLLANFSSPFLFNVNFPGANFDSYKGIRFTRPNSFNYANRCEIDLKDGEEFEYKLWGMRINIEDDDFTDYKAVKSGYISVSPIETRVVNEDLLAKLPKKELSLKEIEL